MDEAESFLMKSRVRSIWPHSRAGGCKGSCGWSIARRCGRSGSVAASRFLGVSLVAAVLVLSLLSRLHSNRGRTRVLGRSCRHAGNLFSYVIGFPHCACGLVGRRIERSRLRRPHAVGGRVNCAARVESSSGVGLGQYSDAFVVHAI